MKHFIQKGTTDMPFVVFDNKSGELYIGGSSLPENVLEVYSPILEWLNEYSESNTGKTFFRFFFDYLNTASSLMMVKIVSIIKKISLKSNIEVDWCYVSGDEDIRELGQELLEDSGLRYQILEEASFSY